MPKTRLLLAALVALAAAGCEKNNSAPRPPATAPATTAKTAPATATAAAAPDPDEAEASMDIAITPAAAARVKAEPKYVQDATMGFGKLVGVVRFAGKVVRSPTAKAEIDFEKGPLAVKDPQPGEVEYYKNTKAAPFTYLDLGHGVGVGGTVLMFKDVKRGPRPPMEPSGFQAIHGTLRCIAGSHGDANITFSPVQQLVTLFTWEAYPADFVLRQASTGKVVYQGRAGYKDTGKDKSAQAVGGGHVIWIASEPTPVQTGILTEPGLYELDLPRHPWKKGWLWVVENPYAAVVGPRFEIADVPVGRHTVQVWHPAFKVLEPTLEFEIRKDDQHEVLIQVEPPEWLIDKSAK